MGAGGGLSPEEAAEARALLRLRQLPGFGDRTIWDQVKAHGSATAALRAHGSQRSLWPGHGGREEDPFRRLGKGIGVLPLTSRRYPDRLRELTDPPGLLFFKGDLACLVRPCVAVVGARRATAVGRRTAEKIGLLLARAGATVLSGMALGIDGAAHRGALRGGGPTVAVLGSGLGNPHPRSHRSLFHEIARHGLALSEFLPEEPARPHHFPRRNRILAALSEAVIVVEAGRRSGALITVDHALDLGREILAVPGSVENPQAEGANALLRDGARVLVSPEAVLEELDLTPQGASSDGGSLLPGAGPSGRGVPSELEPLWSALSREPRTVEEVAETARLSVAEVLAGLSALELGGWAEQLPGMRFRRP